MSNLFCFFLKGKQTEDTLQLLLAKNTSEIEAAHPCLDIIYSQKIAKFLFAIAKALNLPNDTKYLALEIFQRWVLIPDEIVIIVSVILLLFILLLLFLQLLLLF